MEATEMWQDYFMGIAVVVSAMALMFEFTH